MHKCRDWLKGGIMLAWGKSWETICGYELSPRIETLEQSTICTWCSPNRSNVGGHRVLWLQSSFFYIFSVAVKEWQACWKERRNKKQRRSTVWNGVCLLWTIHSNKKLWTWCGCVHLVRVGPSIFAQKGALQKYPLKRNQAAQKWGQGEPAPTLVPFTYLKESSS
jgi:hypothetical protein